MRMISTTVQWTVSSLWFYQQQKHTVSQHSIQSGSKVLKFLNLSQISMIYEIHVLAIIVNIKELELCQIMRFKKKLFKLSIKNLKQMQTRL